jgi:hypothetical protein
MANMAKCSKLGEIIPKTMEQRFKSLLNANNQFDAKYNYLQETKADCNFKLL